MLLGNENVQSPNQKSFIKKGLWEYEPDYYGVSSLIVGYDGNFDKNRAFILIENSRYLFDLNMEDFKFLGELSETVDVSSASSYITLNNERFSLKYCKI